MVEWRCSINDLLLKRTSFDMNIRTYSTLILSIAGALTLTGQARADYTETFSGGTNLGSWSWNFDDTIPGSGGNPGEYLSNDSLDTPGPLLASDPQTASPFVGDIKAAGITGYGFDLKIDHTDFNVNGGEGFGVTLLLINRNHSDNADDWDYAYSIGSLIPDVGSGWKHYSYTLDPNGSGLPTGWKGGYSGDFENFRPGVTWDDIVTHVDQVQFSILSPGWAAIFQNWGVGADNISVTTAPVPEPASMAALGLGALALLRRRKRS